MIAQSLIFRRITDADFKNISGQGGVEGGGGQGYIDIPTSGVNDDQMKKFLGKPTKSVAQGNAWEFKISSLGVNNGLQDVKIYKRRSASFCIASQKVGTKESNRVRAWDSELTGFPDKKYSEENKPLVVYIIKDEKGLYWAGWFFLDAYKQDWHLSPKLSRMFFDSCGYIELENIGFDVAKLDWPFNVSAHGTEITQELVYNRVLFGAPGTGKSYQLNLDSGIFKKQKTVELNDDEKIKAEIQSVSNSARKLNALNALGFIYSEDIKKLSKKEIKTKFDTPNVDELYVGSQAKEYADSINIGKDSGSDVVVDIDFIKAEVKKAVANQKKMIVSINAVGYRFSDYLFDKSLNELKETFELSSEAQMWWLYRGAQAGQIKSKKVDDDVKFVERVTFHPNYSFAQFVGCYKPVQEENEKENGIAYKYVPGPFMRVLKNALKYENRKFLLIVEEINRANVSAVFGDVFQLLDRDENGKSTYSVDVSEDVKKYFVENGLDNIKELKIPSNMFIWATMNSADQGVFPMDTAFKRRWEFEYIDINHNASLITNYSIPMQEKQENGKIIHEWMNWNELRCAINKKLTSLNVNEDKLLGPFFISEKMLKTVNGRNEESAEAFVKNFKSKVLMYLFEDVVKGKAQKLFDVEEMRFSNICKKFNSDGQGIFNLAIE